VTIRSGAVSSFVVRFFALRAKKRTTVEIGSTGAITAGKQAFECLTA
jgi:hypothetical protein